MNATTFKNGLKLVLQSRGFEVEGKSLRRDQSDVSVLVSFEKGFESQWFITVGFWLNALGRLVTTTRRADPSLLSA